ncbi:MAG: potassium/proton antiporter [Fusobacteria bacterium]|nr:potassium/proton antiporter [Fusobacteriota bacterium]
MNEIMILIGIILIISIWSTKLSNKASIPVLIIFIAIGMLAHAEGFKAVHMQDKSVEYAIGSITMAFILFGGGLDTDIFHVRKYWKEGVVLSFGGVVITTLLFAIPVHYLAHFSYPMSFLIGAAVASTDAAAVFNVLKSAKGVVNKKLGAVLELESGSNDPIAYVLVLIFIEIIMSGGKTPIGHFILFFVLQIIIGGAIGYLFGVLTTKLYKISKINVPELYVILILAVVLLTYGMAEVLEGNPFLAVYILGIFIRSKKLMYKNSTIRFFSAVSWVMQIILFVSLGFQIFPKELTEMWLSRSLLALILILIIRPIVVFSLLQLFGKKYHFKDKLFLTWGGLKGAVPIVFAALIYSKGVGNDSSIFNFIFYIVVFSVLVQGSTLSWLGKKLGVIVENTRNFKESISIDEIEYFEDQLIEVSIMQNSWLQSKLIRDIRLPLSALIVSVIRGREYIYPKASLPLEVGDRLLISAENREALLKFIEEQHHILDK